MALLVLRVTEKCNLSCKYCYAYTENPQSMNFETAKLSIDKFFEKFGEFKIQITGGEPFIEYDLIRKILSYTKSFEVDIPVSVQTNGTLLNREILTEIKDNDVDMSISLDAFGKTNDTLRCFKSGEPTFGVVDKAITLMGRLGMSTQLNAVLTNVNVKEVDRLFDYALIKGNIKGVSLDILRGVREFSDVSYAEHKDILEMLDRVSEKIELLSKAGFAIELKDFSKMAYLVNNSIKKEVYCYAQTESSVAVRPNGDYYPCSSFAGDEKYKLGNIEDGFANIKVFDDIRRLPEKCEQCEVKDYCCGACPAGKIYGSNDNECIIKKCSYMNVKNNEKERK